MCSMKKSVVGVSILCGIILAVPSVLGQVAGNVLNTLNRLPLFYEANAFGIDILIAALLFFSLGRKVFKDQQGLALAVCLALTAGFIGIQLKWGFTFGSVYLLVIAAFVLVVAGKIFGLGKGISASKWTVLSLLYIIAFLLLKTKVPAFITFIEDKVPWAWSILWALWFIAIVYLIFTIGGFFHGEKGIASLGGGVNKATSGFGNFLGKGLGYIAAAPFMLAWWGVKLPLKLTRWTLGTAFSLIGKAPLIGKPFAWLGNKIKHLGTGKKAATGAAANVLEKIKKAGLTEEEFNAWAAQHIGGGRAH